MEFTPSQIARLVLGYLKAEKCQGAFDTFFKTSSHLGYNSGNKRAKYIVTRLHGYSLRDFLNEYAQIYNLVQERLEPTDYYEECSSRNLVDQLTYLLDKYCYTTQSTPQRSRSSTPIKESKNKSLFQQNLSVIEEHASSELNTTPLEELPGNSDEFNHISVRRTGIKTNRNTPVEESDSGDSPDHGQEEVGDIEVLKQTLLEHTELHEKIAENINLVIKTTETNKVAEEKLSHELDSAIKAIVDRTEADPIFERLIGDLIGSTEQNDAADRRYSEETDPHSSPSIQLSSNVQQVSNLGNESDPIKQQLRNPKRPSCDKLVENASSAPIQPTKIPQLAQPQAANESIPKVDNAMPLTTLTTPIDVHKNLTVNTNTGDIILYDGTLDTYMKTAPIVSASNPIFFNNNLLMVQPGLIQSTPMATSLASGNPMDKSYYLVNSNPQLINVSVPQYKINNVTEQDILNMPTVIVCDDNRQAVPNRSTKSTVKELPKLLPKEPPESNIREYLTLYQCTDEQQSQSTIVPLKSQVQSRAQKKDPPKTQTIHIEILKPIEKDVKEPPPIQKQAEETKRDVSDKPSPPRPVTPDLTKQAIRKTTPKSGSHVRALDFNLTPGHGGLTAKKTVSPKSARKKSPGKVSSTKISKSLFGSPSKSVKLESNEIKNDDKVEDKPINKKNCAKDKKLASWDSDLRALMGPIKEPSPPKKKKKESGKTSSKKPKVNLNKTETDARAIEENLKNMCVETTEDSSKCEAGNHGEENSDRSKDTKEDAQEETKTVPVTQVEEYDDQSVLTFTLINCNAKSRCKKKCNIDNGISKAVKITKVKEIKSLELVPDNSNKLILSPSKLNANKRTLVDNVESTDKEVDATVAPPGLLQTVSTREIVENKILNNDVKQDKVSANDENEKPISNIDSKEVEKTERIGSKNDKKFITPDMPRNHSALPVTANCNLTPMLDTPIKYLETPIKLSELPKTPGTDIPNNDTITPMTKMLNEQLHGIDLLSIQTPKFPLTPSFPITPFNTKSPYPNRSTDYSTTSSYYQPSDSEQNKSLEALMEECRRLETKVSPTKEVKVEQDEVQIYPLISEKISTFNHSLIARKNLSLVKKDLENSCSDESTTSEEDSSSYSEDDATSSGSDWENTKNETVIRRRADTPYMLRSRTKEDRTSFEKDENVHDALSQAEVKPELSKSLAMNSKEAILKEVEEKRKRTIAKFKQGEKPTPPPRKKQTKVEKATKPKSTPIRDIHGKFKSAVTNCKRKPPNSSQTSTTQEVKVTKPTTTNKRKSKSPVKLLQKINDVEAVNKGITLHISSDDEEINPSDVVETLLAESESSPVGSHPLNTFQKALNTFKTNLKSKEGNEITSDLEARSLVEDLKQRGIYLVPNKVPKKTDKPIDGANENIQGNKLLMKINEDETEIITLVTGEHPSKDTTSSITIIEKPKLSQEKAAKAQNKKTLAKTGVKKQVKDEVSKNTKTANVKPLEDEKPTKGEDKNADSSDNIASSVTKENKISSVDVAKSEDAKDVSREDAGPRSDEGSKAKPSKSESKSKSRKRTESLTKSRQPKKTEPKRTRSKTPRKEPSKLKKDKEDKGKANSNEDRKLNEKEESKEQSIIQANDSAALDDLEKNAVLEKIAEAPISPPRLPVPDANEAASSIEQDLNLTDSLGEDAFDEMTFDEETVTFVYDPQRAGNKKIEDYNLPIRNSCFVVEVFDEQIEMSITPLEILLDLPSKDPSQKIKILQNTVISKGNDSSPLSKLYEHLTPSTSNVNAISPLNNLYSDVNSPRYSTKKVQRLKTFERRRNSMDHKREPTTNSRKTTRSKSVDYNSLSASPNKDVHKPNSEQTDADASADMTIKSEKSSDSNGKSNTKNTDRKDKPLDLNNKETVIKDVIGESPRMKRSPGGIDDELMNYAICGSERIENDVEDKGRGNKRKAADNIDHRQLKQIKCQELLKTMNVDEFLTQLHGES